MIRKITYLLVISSLFIVGCSKDDTIDDSNKIEDFIPANASMLLSKITKIDNQENVTSSVIYTYNNDNLVATVLTSGTYYKVSGFEYEYDSKNRPENKYRIYHNSNGEIVRSFPSYSKYYYNGIHIEVNQVDERNDSEQIVQTIDFNDDKLVTKMMFQDVIFKDHNWDSSYKWENGNIIDYSWASAYEIYNRTSIKTKYKYLKEINPGAYSSLKQLNPESINLISSYETTEKYNESLGDVSNKEYNLTGSYEYEFNDKGFPISAVHNFDYVKLVRERKPGGSITDFIYVFSIQNKTVTIEYDYIDKN